MDGNRGEKMLVRCCSSMKRQETGNVKETLDVKRIENRYKQISPDFVRFPSISPIWYGVTGICYMHIEVTLARLYKKYIYLKN